MKSPNPKPEPKPAEKTVEVATTEVQIQTMMIHSCQLKRKLGPKRTNNKIVESAESLERVADRFDQIGEVEEPDDIQAVREIVKSRSNCS